MVGWARRGRERREREERERMHRHYVTPSTAPEKTHDFAACHDCEFCSVCDKSRAEHSTAPAKAQADAVPALPESEEIEHCKDCCCAQSWKALGIAEYTGKSIPEHIDLLKAQLQAANERAEQNFADAKAYAEAAKMQRELKEAAEKELAELKAERTLREQAEKILQPIWEMQAYNFVAAGQWLARVRELEGNQERRDV